ncbi:hypothetical protein K474DRAFT_1635035 [Panus rudis PR-1116 ss-1]|nr:hypothetical protein K474DRAFT_1635035 [Panus rudis PR-1116 ss-1]
MVSGETKIPLQEFLKALTSNGVPASKAMAAAGKMYKQYNTSATLSFLTDLDLRSVGISEKEDRKLILAALKKAGYKSNLTAGPRRPSKSNAAEGSASAANTNASSSNPEKRKRDNDLNEFLPDRQVDEGETYGDLDFGEILDEEVLMPKFTVSNRAPIMAAWSFVVAERLGFQREEALSIATVYTEMNAISKGVSLGIYDKSKENGVESSKSGTQPYVDLMGRRYVPCAMNGPPFTAIHNYEYCSNMLSRVVFSYGLIQPTRIPLYQTSSGQWRALSSGSPVSPTAAFSYVKRSLQQNAPYIVGALRLLAQSYPPQMLNERGFSLYADFRPDVDGWGKRGEVRCKTILSLRRPNTPGSSASTDAVDKSVDSLVKVEQPVDDKIGSTASAVLSPPPADKDSPDRKKAPLIAVGDEDEDEYDAVLDADNILEGVDLEQLP